MVTFLITSILTVGLIAIAVYFWQKPSKTTETIELPPPPRTASLFAEGDAEQLEATVQETPLEPETQSQDSANKPLPEELLRSWRESPDRVSTARLLHAAALTDDAETYRITVELVLGVWQEEGISEVSAAELQTLINGEFWILSSRTRSSGAGFVLKQTLARAKRELEHAQRELERA